MNIRERVGCLTNVSGFNFMKHVRVSPPRNSNKFKTRQHTDFIHNVLPMRPHNLISTALVQLRDHKSSPHDIVQIRVVRPQDPFNLSIAAKSVHRNIRKRGSGIFQEPRWSPCAGCQWRILRRSLLSRHVGRHGLLGIFLF